MLNQIEIVYVHLVLSDEEDWNNKKKKQNFRKLIHSFSTMVHFNRNCYDFISNFDEDDNSGHV